MKGRIKFILMSSSLYFQNESLILNFLASQFPVKKLQNIRNKSNCFMWSYRTVLSNNLKFGTRVFCINKLLLQFSCTSEWSLTKVAIVKTRRVYRFLKNVHFFPIFFFSYIFISFLFFHIFYKFSSFQF